MEKDPYFFMESTFLCDNAVRGLVNCLGTDGVGIYLSLLIYLRQQTNYTGIYLPEHIVGLAREFNTQEQRVWQVIDDFGLFVVDEEARVFTSIYLNRVMKPLDEYRRKKQVDGAKGGRPKKRVAKIAETPSDKGEKPHDNLRIEKDRIEENRKENNSSRTAVTCDAATDEISLITPPTPLPAPSVAKVLEASPATSPVARSWEVLIDEMEADRSWMNLVGMRCGLGMLYLQHQKEAAMLFREHIRLYDKGGELLRVQEAKYYFANFMAAGSRTCLAVRDRLLLLVQQQEEQNVYRFETLVNGQRTYMGHLIPVDAPPRPNNTDVWDEVLCKWVR